MNLLTDDIKARIKAAMDQYPIQLTSDGDISCCVLRPLFDAFIDQATEYAFELQKHKPVDWDAVDALTVWPKVKIGE